MKYKYYLDPETASAYAAAKKRRDLVEEDDGAIVLLARNHPALSADFIKFCCGEELKLPDQLIDIYKTVNSGKLIPAKSEELIRILESLQK